MIFISFKSFIPFQTPSSIKKYLDDYNKAFHSRIVEHYSEKRENKNIEHFLSNNELNTAIQLNKKSNTNKEIHLYNNNPVTPNNIELSIILFSISSVFMYFLSRKN